MYFKYLFPVLNFLHACNVLPHSFQNIILPLGISFFTFTQIAYLIDIRQEIAKRQTILPYSVSRDVLPAPHRPATIIHPRELMPQFDEDRASAPYVRQTSALGLTWFILGPRQKSPSSQTRIGPLADVSLCPPNPRRHRPRHG